MPEFCPKCGDLLVPQKKGSRVVLICRHGHTIIPKRLSAKEFKVAVTAKPPPLDVVVVREADKMAGLPKTKAQCPKCEHPEAFWWMQQIRASDEPPTRFYRCAKCGHVWREYE
jgi:DNA-directed RNA polymerase subunit M